MGLCGGGRGSKGDEGVSVGRGYAVSGGHSADGPRPTQQQLVNSSNFEAKREYPHARRAVAAEAWETRQRTGAVQSMASQSALVCFVARRSFLYPCQQQQAQARYNKEGHTDLLHSSPDHTGSEQQAKFKTELGKRRGPSKLLRVAFVRELRCKRGRVAWQSSRS